MKIALIDNYDSFTYNLVHILEALGAQVTVYRNDAFFIKDLKKIDKIMISPGPGLPADAGLTKQVIIKFAEKKPILGVCLGHQAIAECFGASLFNLEKVYHGISSQINCYDDYLFENCPQKIDVGRYHSWVVKNSLPKNLKAIAFDQKNTIMALKHTQFDLRGIQFHPESILTPYGNKIIQNWLTH